MFRNSPSAFTQPGVALFLNRGQLCDGMRHATPKDTAADPWFTDCRGAGREPWAGRRLALTGQLGVDRVFVPVSAVESEPGAAGANNIVRQDGNLRFTLPYSRLGASYRF